MRREKPWLWACAGWKSGLKDLALGEKPPCGRYRGLDWKFQRSKMLRQFHTMGAALLSDAAFNTENREILNGEIHWPKL